MAGKKQHFVPQFLQKGFCSRIDGEDVYTYAYRANKPPYEDKTKNIGFENHFYSDSTDTTLDDDITEAEALQFSRLVKKIRERKEVFDIDHSEIVELISHFEIRSRNIRLSMLKTIEPITKLLRAQLQRPEVFTLLLTKKLGDDHPMLRFLELDAMKEQLSRFMGEWFASGEFKKVIKDVMQKVHRQTMSENISPKKLNKILETTNFNIFEGEDIPLGDSMVIYHVDAAGVDTFKTLMMPDDNLIAAILPLTSSSLLIGSSKPYTPNIQRIRSAIAECASEFFIASNNSSELELLNAKIGTNLNLATGEQMQRALREIEASFPV